MKYVYFSDLIIRTLLIQTFLLFFGSSKALDLTVYPGECIQKAIDSVAADGGGKVTLGAGIHHIFSPLRMKSNVTLQGEGDWASLLKTNVNMKMIIANNEGLKNLIIQNLEIQGTNADDGGGIEIISAPDNEHDSIKVINVHCFNTGWGVHIKGAKNVLIDQCLFEKNGSFKPEHLHFSHNLYLRRVYNTIVRNSRFMNSPTGNGINISYSENVEVVNCEISGNKFRGVRAANTSGYKVHDCIIHNNEAVGVLANSESAGVVNVDIQNNCISGNNKGIATPGAGSGIVSNNNSYSNSVADYDLSGVTSFNNVSDSTQTCLYDNLNVVLSANSGNGNVSLEWTLGSIVLGDQDVFRNTIPDPSGRIMVASNLSENSFVDNTVLDGTTYWYWLKATDSSGTVYNSNTKKATPGQNITAETFAGDGFVNLNWVLNNVELETQKIFRDTDSDSTGRTLIADSVSGITYVDTQVSNGTTYWYWIEAIDKSSTIISSNSIMAEPAALIINLDITDSLDAVNLEWSLDNAILGRQDIFRDTDSDPSGRISIASDLKGDSYRDHDVVNGTKYWYWLKITDVNANVQNSTPVNATAVASQSIELSTISDDGSVELSWTLSNITLGRQDVFRDTDSDPSGRTLIGSDVNGSTFTDSNVTNGTTYWYWIKATDVSSVVTNSDAESATPTAPPSITLTSSPGDGSVDLSWILTNITLGRQDVFRDTDSDPSGRMLIGSDVNGSTFTDSNVTNGTTYWYWIKATDVSSIVTNSGAESATPTRGSARMLSDSDIKFLSEKNKEQSIKIFPNPVIDKAAITFPPTTFHSCNVYRVNGKAVVFKRINDSMERLILDFSRIEKGMYYVQLLGDTHSQVVKFIKD